MITFEQFKKIFNSLDGHRKPEIGIYFQDDTNDYMIVKYDGYLTIGRFDCTENEIYKFNNIDELYNATIENICLKENWNEIDDILIDLTFSVIDDKDELSKFYNVDLY